MSFSSGAYSQNKDTDSYLALPGAWETEVTNLNYENYTSQVVGKESICVKESLTTKDALTSTFLQKYSSLCTFSDIEEKFVEKVGRNDFRKYTTNITCGALAGPVEFSVFNTDGNNTVRIDIRMTGELNGTRVGDNTSTKFNWEWVSFDCK